MDKPVISPALPHKITVSFKTPIKARKKIPQNFTYPNRICKIP